MSDWKQALLEEHGTGLKALADHYHTARLAKRCDITRDKAKDLAKWLRSLPAESLDVDIEQRDAYTFNRETQTYVFTLHGAAKAVVMSAERVQQIVADYSNLGAKASVNQIARTHGISRPVVRGILKALGPITHDSLPFTQEQIDEILPRIKVLDFWYTDYGALYKIKMLDENGKELYLINDPDDVYGWDRLNDDGARYIAKKLGITVTSDFGGRSYDYEYYESLVPAFKDKGIELQHDDSMDVS